MNQNFQCLKRNSLRKNCRKKSSTSHTSLPKHEEDAYKSTKNKTEVTDETEDDIALRGIINTMYKASDEDDSGDDGNMDDEFDLWEENLLSYCWQVSSGMVCLDILCHWPVTCLLISPWYPMP